MYSLRRDNQRSKVNSKENIVNYNINDEKVIDFNTFANVEMKNLVEYNDIDILQQNLDTIIFGEFYSQNLPPNVRKYNDDNIKSFRICQMGLKELIRNQEELISDLSAHTIKYNHKKEQVKRKRSEYKELKDSFKVLDNQVLQKSKQLKVLETMVQKSQQKKYLKEKESMDVNHTRKTKRIKFYMSTFGTTNSATPMLTNGTSISHDNDVTIFSFEEMLSSTLKSVLDSFIEKYLVKVSMNKLPVKHTTSAANILPTISKVVHAGRIVYNTEDIHRYGFDNTITLHQLNMHENDTLMVVLNPPTDLSQLTKKQESTTEGDSLSTNNLNTILASLLASQQTTMKDVVTEMRQGWETAVKSINDLHTNNRTNLELRLQEKDNIQQMNHLEQQAMNNKWLSLENAMREQLNSQLHAYEMKLSDALSLYGGKKQIYAGDLENDNQVDHFKQQLALNDKILKSIENTQNHLEKVDEEVKDVHKDINNLQNVIEQKLNKLESGFKNDISSNIDDLLKRNKPVEVSESAAIIAPKTEIVAKNDQFESPRKNHRQLAITSSQPLQVKNATQASAAAAAVIPSPVITNKTADDCLPEKVTVVASADEIASAFEIEPVKSVLESVHTEDIILSLYESDTAAAAKATDKYPSSVSIRRVSIDMFPELLIRHLREAVANHPQIQLPVTRVALKLHGYTLRNIADYNQLVAMSSQLSPRSFNKSTTTSAATGTAATTTSFEPFQDFHTSYVKTLADSNKLTYTILTNFINDNQLDMLVTQYLTIPKAAEAKSSPTKQLRLKTEDKRRKANDDSNTEHDDSDAKGNNVAAIHRALTMSSPSAEEDNDDKEIHGADTSYDSNNSSLDDEMSRAMMQAEDKYFSDMYTIREKALAESKANLAAKHADDSFYSQDMTMTPAKDDHSTHSNLSSPTHTAASHTKTPTYKGRNVNLQAAATALHEFKAKLGFDESKTESKHENSPIMTRDSFDASVMSNEEYQKYLSDGPTSTLHSVDMSNSVTPYSRTPNSPAQLSLTSPSPLQSLSTPVREFQGIQPQRTSYDDTSLLALKSTFKQLKKEFSSINDMTRMSDEDFQKKLADLRNSTTSLPDNVVSHIDNFRDSMAEAMGVLTTSQEHWRDSYNSSTVFSDTGEEGTADRDNGNDNEIDADGNVITGGSNTIKSPLNVRVSVRKFSMSPVSQPSFSNTNNVSSSSSSHIRVNKSSAREEEKDVPLLGSVEFNKSSSSSSSSSSNKSNNTNTELTKSTEKMKNPSPEKPVKPLKPNNSSPIRASSSSSSLSSVTKDQEDSTIKFNTTDTLDNKSSSTATVTVKSQARDVATAVTESSSLPPTNSARSNISNNNNTNNNKSAVTMMSPVKKSMIPVLSGRSPLSSKSNSPRKDNTNRDLVSLNNSPRKVNNNNDSSKNTSPRELLPSPRELNEEKNNVHEQVLSSSKHSVNSQQSSGTSGGWKTATSAKGKTKTATSTLADPSSSVSKEIDDSSSESSRHRHPPTLDKAVSNNQFYMSSRSFMDDRSINTEDGVEDFLTSSNSDDQLSDVEKLNKNNMVNKNQLSSSQSPSKPQNKKESLDDYDDEDNDNDDDDNNVIPFESTADSSSDSVEFLTHTSKDKSSQQLSASNHSHNSRSSNHEMNNSKHNDTNRYNHKNNQETDVIHIIQSKSDKNHTRDSRQDDHYNHSSKKQSAAKYASAMITSDDVEGRDDSFNMSIDQSAELQSNYMSELEIKLNERKKRLEKSVISPTKISSGANQPPSSKPPHMNFSQSNSLNNSNNNSRASSPSSHQRSTVTANRMPPLSTNVVSSAAVSKDKPRDKNYQRDKKYSLDDSDDAVDNDDLIRDFDHNENSGDSYNMNNLDSNNKKEMYNLESPSSRKNSRVSFGDTSSTNNTNLGDDTSHGRRSGGGHIMTPLSNMSKTSGLPFDILSQSGIEDDEENHSYASLSYSQENFDTDLDDTLDMSVSVDNYKT